MYTRANTWKCVRACQLQVLAGITKHPLDRLQHCWGQTGHRADSDLSRRKRRESSHRVLLQSSLGPRGQCTQLLLISLGEQRKGVGMASTQMLCFHPHAMLSLASLHLLLPSSWSSILGSSNVFFKTHLKGHRLLETLLASCFVSSRSQDMPPVLHHINGNDPLLHVSSHRTSSF